MTPEKTYAQVVDRIEELVGICKRKKWSITQKPIIKRPASIRLIEKIENQIGQSIPEDLKKLFQFSRNVEFSYQFDETLSEEFGNNFSGELYWNLEKLPNQVTEYKQWVKASLDPNYNDPIPIEVTRNICSDKIPLLNVPNGDVIVVGKTPSEIVYLSHEGDVMHGKRLGDDLWSFLDFHSRIGFAGSEDWQLEPFFDFEKDEMKTTGGKVDRFINLIHA